MVGDVVGSRYELEELVGTGGMSSVFRAHDTLLERRVALKLLHEQAGRDEQQVERFKREARAVAQLSHPNIVTVIDRGEEGGRQYIVFEYVEGENLKELVLRAGRLPVRRAIEVGLQVAHGLAFAHRHGLVHRDVKPQNVLLADGCEAKVTDFGIARALDVDGLTLTGTVVGTSHYIAPEQARDQPVDARTDVYSLGAVLYELLAGDVPFSGENFVSVALRHLNEPSPSVREGRPEVSPRLDAALARAMAKEPGERFQSMDEFAGELQACLAELGPDTEHDATMVVRPATPPPPAAASPREPMRPRGTAVPLALAAVFALAAGAALTLIYFGIPDLGGGSGGRTTTGGATSPLAAVQLQAVRTWDPFGDHSEHDDQIANATDHNATTYWTTEGYNDGLGKPGVGLVLATRQSAAVASVTITSDTPGFEARIQSGAAEDGPFRDASQVTTVGSKTTIQLTRPVQARYLVVWITKLAHPDKYRAHLNEVTAKGRVSTQ
jgi:hypothetical protein